MRRVLVVSFRFPPHGDGGVHRVAAFTKYLPRFGWRPHVLTGPFRGQRSLYDPSLVEKIPPAVDVTRSGHWSTKGLDRWLRRLHILPLVRMLTPSLPMTEATWIPFGYRTGTTLLDLGDFDAIYSSAYPMSSHIVAGLLARRSGLPWVADYRDEWSTRSVLKWPTPWHRRLAYRIDRKLTTAANRVVTTSPLHTEIFQRTFRVDGPGHYVTITNGFDEEDFDDDPIPPGSSAPRNDRFSVAHVGSLGSGRSGDGLLAAVRKLTETGRIPADEIELLFVGRTKGLEGNELEERGILRRIDLIPHPEAVNTMRLADLLVLINNEGENILGKTFEYLAAMRPILALVPLGATADIVEETGAGVVFSPEDVEGIAEALADSFQRWKEGRLDATTDPARIRGYSRRETTRGLGEVLDAAAGPQKAERSLAR